MEPKDLPPATRTGQYLLNLVLGGMVRLALALPYRMRVPLIGWLVVGMASLLGVGAALSTRFGAR